VSRDAREKNGEEPVGENYDSNILPLARQVKVKAEPLRERWAKTINHRLRFVGVFPSPFLPQSVRIIDIDGGLRVVRTDPLASKEPNASAHGNQRVGIQFLATCGGC